MSYLSVLEDELARKRRAAQLLAEQRREMAFARIPELNGLENRRLVLISQRLELMKQGKDYSSLDAGLAEIRAMQQRVLEDNDLSFESFEPQYSCKLCDDTGYINGKRCSCLENARLRALYRGANIQNAEKQSFETFDFEVFEPERREQMRKLYNYCLAYAQNFSHSTDKGMIFCGQTGVGKTFLLNCIGGEVLRRGYSVFAAESYDIMNYFGDRDTAEERKKLLCNVDLLLIDELGMEQMLSNITIEYFFMVVNERYRNGKPIIISTNMLPDQLKQRYTERVTSRLLDKDRNDCFLLQGKDLRGR